MYTKEELEDIIDQIEKIEYLSDYWNLYNLAIDIDDEMYYVFEDYIDKDLLEDMAKSELDLYGIDRLACFLPEQILGEEIFRLDGYANAQNVGYDEFEDLKDEVIKVIKTKIAMLGEDDE